MPYTPIAPNIIQIFVIGTNHNPAPISIASAKNATTAHMVGACIFISARRRHACPNKKFFKYPLITMPIGIAKYPTNGNAATYITAATANEIMLVFTGVRTSWDAYRVLL